MTDRELLRHAVATVAYRAGLALADVPESFGTFAAGNDTRTPEQILAHMGDVLSWALTRLSGAPPPSAHSPAGWTAECGRFRDVLHRLDAYLGSAEPLHAPVDKVMQGPVSDALTHVGQIAMLRRLAGVGTVPGRSYFTADIRAGDHSKEP